jgi:membrane fusion protein, multidrug efflux system
MTMNKHTLFTIAGIAVILIAGVFVSFELKKTPQVNFVAVKKADITQAVSVDGTVDSAQDLSLAFENGGTVTQINVSAGDTVKKGQLLVKLDTGTAAAALSQAQAALSAAQANYEKRFNGK